jgi:Uma2 family endonuclease
MADSAAPKLMDGDEFLKWCLTQETKWELVDGVPVPKDLIDPATGMTGTTIKHDRVTGNIFASMHARLRGKPCSAFTQDIAVRTRPGSKIRRPDVLVDCGNPDAEDMDAAEPTVVFEVLSPTTRQTDLLRKAEEYKGVGTLKHIVMVEADVAIVLHYARATDGSWQEIPLEGLEAVIELGEISETLPLSEVYEGVELGT